MAIGRAGVVRKKHWQGVWWCGREAVFLPFFSFLPVMHVMSKRPSIHPVRQSAVGVRYCLLYKAARWTRRRTTVRVREGQEEEMGSEFGAASVYSIAIAASLPNYWGGGPTLALSFFFD
jgi:hypothetical protein